MIEANAAIIAAITTATSITSPSSICRCCFIYYQRDFTKVSVSCKSLSL
jgi:hypothetical protein